MHCIISLQQNRNLYCGFYFHTFSFKNVRITKFYQNMIIYCYFRLYQLWRLNWHLISLKATSISRVFDIWIFSWIFVYHYFIISFFLELPIHKFVFFIEMLARFAKHDFSNFWDGATMHRSASFGPWYFLSLFIRRVGFLLKQLPPLAKLLKFLGRRYNIIKIHDATHHYFIINIMTLLNTLQLKIYFHL